MEWNPSGHASALPSPKIGQRPCQERRGQNGAEMKARQSAKIRELGDAVRIAGFLTLDEQAEALGLARSTAWTITQACHKASGLSASIINRMLAAPRLPPLARSKIFEYIEEKTAGLYGGSTTQRRRFAARLTVNDIDWAADEES